MSGFVAVDGSIGGFGENGCQVEDLLLACVTHLKTINAPPHGNRETSLAITKIEEGILWLREHARKELDDV